MSSVGPSTSSFVAAATDELHFSVRTEIGKRPKIRSFHVPTRSWRDMAASSLLDSVEDALDSGDMEGTGHLPEAVRAQLAMLRRAVVVEQAHVLGSSGILLTLAPDRLRLLHKGAVLSARRHARAPKVDFAFASKTAGSVIYGGVNVAHRASLQVDRADSVEGMMEALTSGPDTSSASSTIFRRFPSTSSEAGPTDFSKALYSLDGAVLRITTPLFNDARMVDRISVITVDVETGASSEAVVVLSGAVLPPSEYWSGKRRGKSVASWRHLVVGAVSEAIYTVDTRTGSCSRREMDSPIESLTVSPSGRLLICVLGHDEPVLSSLAPSSLSSLARHSLVGLLPPSNSGILTREDLPESITDVQLISMF